MNTLRKYLADRRARKARDAYVRLLQADLSIARKHHKRTKPIEQKLRTLTHEALRR